MNGVFVPNMEIPKRCSDCPMFRIGHDGYCWCRAKGTGFDREDHQWLPLRIAEWCPLIRVEDCGRLVDADALIQKLKPVAKAMESNAIGTWGEVWAEECREISESPTVIPGEV